MLPILNIGPLAIQAPGLIILIGIWLALTLIEKNSVKFNVDSNVLSNLILWFLLSIVLFARIGYVAKYFSVFVERPLSILSPNLALFDPLSGLILGSVFFLVLIQRKKLHFRDVLNALTPGLSIFAIFYFLSLLASGQYYGLPSSLPWAIPLWGIERHPLQLYYVLLLIILSAWIFWLVEKEKKISFLFLEFVRWFSVILIFLDFFRGDGAMQIGSIHILQIVGFLLLLSSFILLKRFQAEKISPSVIQRAEK
ncbi:MAG: hypothetical protein BGO78_16245 [Chloroflexi bacterium 44-23]|nr:MAG: hypothetical protein BGO78_16245 [Chloroflexi bacterium 44-23]